MKLLKNKWFWLVVITVPSLAYSWHAAGVITCQTYGIC